MDHLRNLIEGARRVLVLGDERPYIRPRGGFARDAAALRGDFRHVAGDLKRGMAQHGQQVDNRKG
jgi:hypothetical protein